MKKRGIFVLFLCCFFLVGCGEEKCYDPEIKIITGTINIGKTTEYDLKVSFENTNTGSIDGEIVDIVNGNAVKNISLEDVTNKMIVIKAENQCGTKYKQVVIKRELTDEEQQARQQAEEKAKAEKEEEEKRRQQEEQEKLKAETEKKEDWLKQYRQNMGTNNNTLYNILLDENNNDKYFRVDCIDSCKNGEVKVTLKDDEATEKRSKTSEKANMKENKIFAIRYTNLMYNKTSKDFIIITHLYYKGEEVSICAGGVNKYYVECFY